MYMDSLAHYYDLSVDNCPDLGVVGGNPAAGSNIVSHPEGMLGGRCSEYNGNNSNHNLGDIAELNAVTAFTIAFWMNQDVLDVVDVMAIKLIGTNYVQINTHGGGQLRAYVTVAGATAYGAFDYSTVINANQWHYLAMVFDGTQTGNANRLVIYVDAVPMTLTFVGAEIPALSPDMSGGFLRIGNTGDSFDGKLDSMGIFSSVLTRLQVADFRLRTMRGAL